MKLIIVESPTKARTIKHYLSDFDVVATMGHIKDLPKSKLGVDIEKGFKPNYRVIRGKKKVINKIRKAGKESDEIFIATDPDREGEAIAFHVQEEIPKRARRALFYEMTENGIKRGLENPSDIDENRVLSQRARRILDRLVGYKISPILWKIVKKGLSAGRVQSVVLRIICEREDEIEDFVPEDYWVFSGLFEHENGKFKADLWKIEGESAKVYDEEKREEVMNAVRNLDFSVDKYRRKDVRKSPYPPFITSTLQRMAASKLNFSTKKTMYLAQRLFEGVELEEGQTGLITYMRTDSVRISKEALGNIRSFIGENYGNKYLPEKPKRYKSGKASQGAHEAIRPTDIRRTPEFVKKYLKRDEFKLYQLIWKQALASQFKSAVFDRRRVILKGDGFKFKGSSRNIKFDGFYKILGKPKKQDEIPLMEAGDDVNLIEFSDEKKTTGPPPRYSEATMVKEMEKQGIGRPSTYSPTISKLLDRGYIDKIKGSLVPQEMGRVVNRILVANFDSIINCDFTKDMEETLDKIEEGEKDWQESLSEFYGPFKENLKEVEEKIPDIKERLLKHDEKECPHCGRKLIVKWDKNGGKFLACPGFPKECEGYIESHPENFIGRDCPMEDCDGKLVIKHSKYGRFISCTNFPECDYSEPIKTGVTCPECKEGEFIEKKSKKGKIYFPCSNKECDNVVWDRPVPEECPECKAPFMVLKHWKKGDFLFCIKCKYKERFEEE